MQDRRFDQALSLLKEGKLTVAKDVMLDLLIDFPNDSDLLYNIGMCYSDLGETGQAVDFLKRCIALTPDLVNAHVALGVAYSRLGKNAEAEESLRKALARDPDNPYALRNLGGLLAAGGKLQEAVTYLRRADEVLPGDVRTLYGLGRALMSLGEHDSADGYLERFLDLEAPDDLKEQARTMRREIAEKALRAKGGFRPDVLFYCFAALEKFSAMPRDEVQKIAFEIALKGRGGLDINDPDKRYTLNSMPGDFTGLQMVSYMYVGFQMTAPDQDTGIDLSAEYKQAKMMFDKGERPGVGQKPDLRKASSLAAHGSQAGKSGELDLIEPVRSILEQVRELTGKGFRFIEKNDLQGSHASVKMARRNMPEHLIFYRGVHDNLINHLVAHECGHILRLFRAPPEKRKMITTNEELCAKALAELADEIDRIRRPLNGQDLTEMLAIWYYGIVRQIGSQPADTMIEKWLYQDYPEIRPVQALSLKKQMRESLQALLEQVQRATPAKVYDANCTMNYAYFKLLSDFANLPLHSSFKDSRYQARGEELYTLTRKEHENSYEGDLAMTNKWAEFLGLTGWFYWADFEAVPNDYVEAH